MMNIIPRPNIQRADRRRADVIGRLCRSAGGTAAVFVLAIAMLLVTLPASAANTDAATDLVEKVIADGTDAIAAARQSRDQSSRFASIFDAHFAVDDIGAALLGARWQTLSANDRRRFLDAFGAYMIDRLVTRVPDGEFKIVDAVDSPADTVVRTVFVTDNSSHAVGWTVVSTAAGMKVLDVTLGGKSVIADKQRDFAEFLQDKRQSIDTLIAFLKE